MKEGKIVIIEGTSCVGKTTLCKKLEKQDWVVLPEAIRYLEKERKQKNNEIETPGAESEEEEIYIQEQFFRIERQKIIEANRLKKEGKNVVIDKSFIATVATAKAFERQKNFKGTFRRAYFRYCDLLLELNKNGLVECDFFFLLVADYATILKRNTMRNHVLNGIWIEEDTVKTQRDILEKMTKEIVGCMGNTTTKIIDTTYLSKDDLESIFYSSINELRKEDEYIKI